MADAKSCAKRQGKSLKLCLWWGVLFISMIGLSMNGYAVLPSLFCYQESANDSTQVSSLGITNNPLCNLNYTGKYLTTLDSDPTNTFDGDYNTFGTAAISGFLYINYTKPNATYFNLNNVTLTYKTQDGFTNLSIPKSCMDFNEKILALRYFVNNQVDYINPSCYISASDVVILHSHNGVDVLYEEGIWWNLSYNYGLDNCSNSFNIPSNATAYYIDFKDPTNTKTTVDYAATLNYWLEEDNVFNYSLEHNNIQNVSYCIYPNWANLTGNFQIEYTDSDAETLNYFTYHSSFTNVTQNLTLYTQNGTTQVLFTVKDINNNKIENAYIHILKYNIGTGIYTTTEIIKTDSQGQAIGYIVLGTTFYNFLVYYDGALAYSELGVKILTTTRNFIIDISGSNWWNDFETTLGVNTDLYFNNLTNNFVYTWSDPTGSMHYACLKVDLTNDSGKYTLNDTCTQSASGTIVQNIPLLQNGTTYIGTGYLKYDNIIVTNVVYKVIHAIRDFSRTDPFGSLWIGFLFIFACMLIGIPNPTVAMALMAVGMIFSVTFGFWAISGLQLGALVILILIQMYVAGRQDQ